MGSRKRDDAEDILWRIDVFGRLLRAAYGNGYAENFLGYAGFERIVELQNSNTPRAAR